MAKTNVTAFVRMKKNRRSEIEEAVFGLEGFILGAAYDKSAAIVDVPEENLNLLREHDAISRVYVGKIPHSTVRGYNERLQFLARMYHACLRPIEPATKEEAERLREAIHRGA